MIFLSVAAFLLNVVVTRLVSTQRPVIALLKAFGYSSRAVAVHYGQLILIITGLGILGGFALGAWLGGRLADRLGGRDVRWYMRLPAIQSLLCVPFVPGLLE